MSNQAPAVQTSYQWFQERMQDRTFVHRWASRHVMLESLLCIISLYITAVVPSTGSWMLLSSLISLVGGSIPLCCCPTIFGWRTNIILQCIAAFIKSFLFFSTVIMLSRSKNPLLTRVLLIALCFIITSLSSVFPFIAMSRSMLYNAAVIPGGEDIMMQQGQPVYTQATPATYAMAPAVVVVHPIDQHGNAMPHQQFQYVQVPQYQQGSIDHQGNIQVQYAQAIPINSQAGVVLGNHGRYGNMNQGDYRFNGNGTGNMTMTSGNNSQSVVDLGLISIAGAIESNYHSNNNNSNNNNNYNNNNNNSNNNVVVGTVVDIGSNS